MSMLERQQSLILCFKRVERCPIDRKGLGISIGAKKPPYRKGGKTMKKILAILTVVFLLSFGFSAPSNAANSITQNRFTTLEMDDLIGTLVKYPDGEVLGFISDFVIDPGGRVVFAILWQGALADINTGRYVAVPFSALSISGRERVQVTAVLNIGQTELDSLPSFKKSKDLDNSEWATSIYRHFGLVPYWAEEEAGKPGPATNSPEGGYDYPY